MTSPSQSKPTINRREFLGSSARNAASVAAGVLSVGVATNRRPGGPNQVVRVGIVGVGQQGRELAFSLARIPGVEITAICDVDVKVLALSQHELLDQTGVRPAIVTAHENLVDRNDVDAIVVATPDHWHARIAIDAMRAGKDLYLEQPVAHSIQEGRLISEVAEATNRIVQTGLPQRSGAHFQSAVQLVQSGEIGRVHLAKAWATHRRRDIGRSAKTSTPPGIDYDRWIGPAPSHAFQPNRFHQNWNWFWDYGSGELGVWGVQLLDVVRWGLDLELPHRIVSTGSRRVFHDDRETPDTLTVQYEFPDVDVIWEHRQWCNRGIEGRTAACAFYGENGTLIVDRSGWKVYGGREGLYADASEIHQSHLSNWIQSLQTRHAPAAPLAVGEKSMVMCHLGNIACRLRRELRFDPQSMTFGGDEAANSMLNSPARSPWQITEG
ncbi:Gfo/Idh/MocA family protein [Planctomicrobium sp. SH668]|uniref:Gfo/Idh/MocA family protein n=1 Tax=Planctomicrobium sp. SH668 TaxID=3448126 RepID=UPI003F5C3035